MKTYLKRLLGAMLAIIMIVSMVPNGMLKASAAATAQNTYATGDIIEFGSYPQTKVADAALITALDAQTLQADSTVTYDGSKYLRVYFTTATNSYQATNGYNINTAYWFKFEPLQWRILSNTNGELFVMAEKILESRAYNQVSTDVTWETCTMRSWLNDDFYNTAFNSIERAAIKTSTVVNDDNPWYGTEGGNNTNDKLYLLSYAEAMNPDYGFSSSPDGDTARIGRGTDYSKSQGLCVNNENSYWWLRSPGTGPDLAGLVDNADDVYNYYSSVYSPDIGARPAFKINSADITSTYATGDIIEFGSYPQTKVADAALITALDAQTLQADSTVTYDGSKYKRVYFETATNSYQATNGYNINTAYWFKFEPLQWRILSNTNGELFVIADKILTTKLYNQDYIDVTWETCTMRTWLNNDFYNTAFNLAQRLKIKTSSVVNEDNPVYDTSGGNSTNDKLFLLSYAEAMNPDYGFSSSTDGDTARIGQGTDYSKSQGLYDYLENGYWWLRSPGSRLNRAGVVNNAGSFNDLSGGDVNLTFVGTRPAFKINSADITSTYATGDIFTFGSYPQTKVTDENLIATLNSQTLQADNTVTYDGAKYKRVYFETASNEYQATNGYNINTVYWFKFEPLQWRVLSNTNGEIFVMAEEILDSKAYNQVRTDITWETCTMRTWLNDDFYNTAFNSTERAAIKTSTVVNDDNPWVGTSGGNNTNDKLFLLSYAEAMNPDYGFSSSTDEDTARIGQGTDYSKSQGLYVNNEHNYWWLRSPGLFRYDACHVSNGSVFYIGNIVNGTYVGVRTAFKINLKSEIFTSSENSGCVVDYDKMTICGLSAGATSLAGYVNVASGYELSYSPTQNGFGTGTIANVTKNGEIVQSYTIFIYGDVNGDGSIDSIDAGTMVDYENYMISWDPVADAASIAAGDLNADGSIDSIDASIAVDSENYMSFINQSTGISSIREAIDGTVVITGLPKLGDTLTADTTNITPSGATLTYIWKCGGTVVGTDKTYIVTANDIGKSITVTVTGSGGFSGGVRSTAVVVAKVDVAAPAAPNLNAKTFNSVTLNAVAGQEYKLEGGAWQASAVFTGLNKNTAYNFYTRVAETATQNASASSAVLSVTTDKAPISGTVIITGNQSVGETLNADISGVLPDGATLSYKWKIGSVIIGTDSTYTVLDADIGESITVTVTGTGDYTGSITSGAVVVTE